MTTAEHDRLIRRLGGLAGVEPSFRSVRGERVRASVEATAGILAALGHDLSSDASIADSIESLEARANRVLAPVSVVRADGARMLEVGELPERTWRAGTARVVDEAGGERTYPLRKIGERTLGGGRRMIDLRPLDLEIGYATLILELRSGTVRTELLVRPGTAPVPERAFGVFAPLYGLRSERDWGIGSTSELAGLCKYAARHGANFVATLPLYPAFYDLPEPEVSPYRPVSKVAWNEIFLDVTSLPELAAAPDALAVIASPRTRREIAALRGSTRVEYEQVFSLKRSVIAACAEAVAKGPRKAAFAAFCSAHPEATAYARFRAARETKSAADRLAAIEYHRYCQFAMDVALAEVTESGVGLYLDLPLGVHPSGFDPAEYPSAFLTGASIGAPPDDFYVDGQVWGIPPIHPDTVRAGDFGYVRLTYRHLFRRARVVRFDHVMGLERYYVVPDGTSAAAGAYLRSPSAELRAIAAIEAARADVTLVGEDLGTVPTETRTAMRKDGMLRSAVYQLEASAGDTEPKTPAAALASFGTHDLPRFAQFVEGGEIAIRVESGAFAPEEAEATRTLRRVIRRALEARGDAERGQRRAYRGFLRWLADTRAALGVVDLGDLLDDPEPENRPGPDSGTTSWRHRMPLTLAELDADRRLGARLDAVAAGRPRGKERETEVR